MIRNLFYSLFLHFILILLVYFNFNFSPPPPEVDKTIKIAISFVAKAGNSNNAKQAINPAQMPTTPVAPTEMPKVVPPEKVKPAPKTPENKPVKKKSKPKKPTEKPLEKPLEKPKADAKKTPPSDPKHSKPKEKDAKTDANKIKEPNEKPDAKQEPEKPKEEKKKPEVKEVKQDKEVVDKEQLDQDKTTEELLADDSQEEDDKDEEDIDEGEIDQYSFTENTIESLNLLAREKFNIQNQIKRCYKKAIDQSGIKNKTVINAHIIIAKDGFIDLSAVTIKDFYRYENPKEVGFRQAVDIVKQSLKFCSPIRNLPQDKYEVWKEIDLQFEGE